MIALVSWTRCRAVRQPMGQEASLRFLGSNHIGILPTRIQRSVEPAMHLGGWPQATAVQAAILRGARLRYAAGLLWMRSVESELIGLMESID
jgi:hypothetical protein